MKTSKPSKRREIPKTFHYIALFHSWVSTLHCVVKQHLLCVIPILCKSLSNPAKCMSPGDYESTAEHEEVESRNYKHANLMW